MITDYNATMGAVVFLNKMVAASSCERMTRRWHVAIFLNMSNISCFSAYVWYCGTYLDWRQKRTVQRRLFLEDLAMEFLKAHFERIKTLPYTNASLGLVQLVQSDVAQTTSTQRLRVLVKECRVCPSSKDMKTSKICEISKIHVYPKRSENVCLSCCNDNNTM